MHRERYRARHRRVEVSSLLSPVVAIVAVLAALIAQPAQATETPKPLTGEVIDNTQPTKPLVGTTIGGVADSFHPGRYWDSLRWTPSGDHVTICFANHSSHAFQQAVSYWGLANDLQAPYEGGPDACDGYNNQHRVDIYNGTDTSRGCSYTYSTATSDNHVGRMILYTAPNTGATTGCFTDEATTAQNQLASRGIGFTLGNYLYVLNTNTCDATCQAEWGLRVMRTDQCPEVAGYCVSWAQSGDRQTFDWFNPSP